MLKGLTSTVLQPGSYQTNQTKPFRKSGSLTDSRPDWIRGAGTAVVLLNISDKHLCWFCSEGLDLSGENCGEAAEWSLVSAPAGFTAGTKQPLMGDSTVLDSSVSLHSSLPLY